LKDIQKDEKSDTSKMLKWNLKIKLQFTYL